MNTPTFEQWMKELDALVGAALGVCTGDLSDMCYRDMFQSGMAPDEALDDVIEQVEEDFGGSLGLFDLDW